MRCLIFKRTISLITCFTVLLSTIIVTNVLNISANSVTEILVLSDEDGENPGFCAVPSDEKAKVGDYSYKATPGTDGHDYWLIRTRLARTLNISKISSNATKGSLSFWIWVENKYDVRENWSGSQLQLGENWDKNVYQWNNWETQIKDNGWNRIILNFSASTIKGEASNMKAT